MWVDVKYRTCAMCASAASWLAVLELLGVTDFDEELLDFVGVGLTPA
jgi:hypothetical protein